MMLSKEQIIAILVVLVVVLLCLKLIKGLLKWCIIAGVVCIGLVYFNIATPKQIHNIAGQIADKGVESYQKIADNSENIRIKDNKIQIRVDAGKWLSIDKLGKIVSNKQKELIVTYKGKEYKVTDKNVKKLLESFQ